MGKLDKLSLSLIGEMLDEGVLMDTNVYGKPPSVSACRKIYQVMRSDLNIKGTLYGGRMMYLLDEIAATIAEKHTEKICATLLVDQLKFIAPAYRDDFLIFEGAVNRAWNTSIEIGIKVSARAPNTRKLRLIVSAYFTFVGVDENGKPVSVPALIPVTNAEKKRYLEADERRQQRLASNKK